MRDDERETERERGGERAVSPDGSGEPSATTDSAGSEPADATGGAASNTDAATDATSDTGGTTDTTSDAEGTDVDDASELAVQVELLAAENERLRREYSRARQSKHTRAALGLGALGVLSLVAGVLFPAAQTVLFALGGTGLFVGVLTYYLTPERFVSATVGDRIYEALASNHASLAAELGLGETRLYVPLGDSPDAVRLFVPQHVDYRIPAAEELRSVLVLPDDERGRGFAVRPTGDALFAEFRSTTVDEVSDVPAVLAAQLADALVESLEIAASAAPDVDPEGGRVSVAIADSAYGPVDRFDHPIASFLGTGMAIGLDVPTEVTVTAGDDRAEAVVTCTWSNENGE